MGWDEVAETVERDVDRVVCVVGGVVLLVVAALADVLIHRHRTPR